MPHRTLTPTELAAYLHVSLNDVERLLRESDIPRSKRGTRIVFQRSEIDAWASQRILGMPDRRLEAYHEKTIQGTREIFPHTAIVPELLKPTYIDLELASKTRASVIRDMVALAARTGRLLDPKELQASVEAREQLCSTALPGGLALMHARQHDAYRFDESFIVFGRTIQAVPYGAPDGRATRLFFLICCQDDRIHLHTLARLCVMAMKTDVVVRLFDAPDADTACAAMVESEKAVLPGQPPAGQQ